MRNIAIVDESFDINITASYHLSIQVNQESVSFAVLDTVRNKYIAFKHHHFEKSKTGSPEDQFRRILETDNYLIKKYKSAALIYSTINASLIPNPLFEEDKLEDLFCFSNYLPDNHTICSSKFALLDARVIFAVPEKILVPLRSNPNDFKLYHQSNPLIDQAFAEAGSKDGPSRVYLNATPGFIDIVLMKNGQLVLYNSFIYRSDEDLIFYLLYVYEQFSLNPGQAVLTVSGTIEKESAIIDKLSDYIKDIRFASFSRGFNYSYTFGQLKQHRYHNLINLYNCV